MSQKQQTIKRLDSHPDFRGVSEVYFAQDVHRRYRKDSWGMSCRFPGEFLPVAEIESVNLDEILDLLSMEHEYLGEDAHRIRLRNICTGDVVKTPGGDLWVVDNFGFKRMEEHKEMKLSFPPFR